MNWYKPCNSNFDKSQGGWMWASVRLRSFWKLQSQKASCTFQGFNSRNPPASHCKDPNKIPIRLWKRRGRAIIVKQPRVLATKKSTLQGNTSQGLFSPEQGHSSTSTHSVLTVSHKERKNKSLSEENHSESYRSQSQAHEETDLIIRLQKSFSSLYFTTPPRRTP